MMIVLILQVYGIKVEGETLTQPEADMRLAPHRDRQVLIDEQVFQKLIKEGYLALDNNLNTLIKGCAEDYLVRQIAVYKIRCKATWDDDGSGCYGTGPIGYDHHEACREAVLEGWQIIEDCWACPSHVNAKHNEELAKHTEGE